MGWIGSLFGKEVVRENVTLRLGELAAWFEVQKKELLQQADVQETAIGYYHKMKDFSWILEAELGKLSPSEQEALPQILRACQNLQLFLSQVEVSDVSADKVLRLHEQLSKHLEKILSKNEGEQLLQPLEDLTLIKQVLELDALRAAFEKKVSQRGLYKLLSLQEKAQELGKAEQKMLELQPSLQDKQERLAYARQKMAEKEADLHSLRSQYQEADMWEQQRQQLSAQREELLALLQPFFTALQPALKEYLRQHPESEAELQAYLLNPLKALREDKELTILRILKEIELALGGHKTMLTLEQVQQAMQQLESIKLERLPQFHLQYCEVQQQLERLAQQRQGKNDFIKIEDATYRWQHYQALVAKLEADASQMEDDKEEIKMQVEREKQLLQDMVKVGLQKEIQIISP